MSAKRFADAEALYLELLAIDRTLRPDGDLELARTLSALGESLLGQNKSVEAERFLSEAVSTFEKAQLASSLTYHTQSLLGGAMLQQKKYDAAAPLLLKSYAGLKERDVERPSPSHMQPLKEAGERIVQLYEAWGKSNQAAEWRQKLAEANGASPP